MPKYIHLLVISLFLLSCNTDPKNLHGYDFGLFNNTSCKALAEAVENEDIEDIRREVLVNKIPVDCVEPKFRRTLLMLAVRNQKYRSVEALLKLKANPNLQDSSGYTGLTEALGIGSGGVVHDDADPRYLKLILKYGGDPNAIHKAASIEETVLETACSSGVLEYVKILVAAGAKIDVHNKNLLYNAVISSSPDIVLFMLKNGVNHKYPLSITFQGEKHYLIDVMNGIWSFDKGSKQYQIELQIRKWLKEHH